MNSITKLHVLFFFVFIFYTVSCTAKLEKQTYTNVYDLHFAMRSDSAVFIRGVKMEHIAIILSLLIYKIQIEICSLKNILKDFLFLSG